ncbi:MAG: DEAD/DEAH box helicase [Spirochaetales bacterium]|nr:DEAD/DEAH box helicase [Spirochaetales bacterium]
MKFTELNLDSRVLKAITELGFEYPTPIQEKVIPEIIKNTGDIVGLAQTGTGKTAAFSLPVLEKIDTDVRGIQALVLCPTRELCLQIARDIESYTKYISGFRVAAVYGGAAYGPQIKELKSGSQFVISTPGRLADLISKGKVDFSTLKYLVLDEADIMLNMGFKDELDAIVEALPVNRTSLLFSATMPREVEAIAKRYMHDAVELSAGKKNAGASTVTHSYYVVHAKDKFQALKRLVDYYPGIFGIVFCKTRASARDIAERMIKEGYSADALHGDLSQEQREYVMGKFREGGLQLLIATDVAARGLDVKNLSHVIHYDLPDEIEIYNHRSGRTGRAGASGISLAIINMRERGRIRRIEQNLGRKITEAKVPGKEEICQAQLLSLLEKVQNVNVDEAQIAPYMGVIEEKFAGFTGEELVKKFVSLEFSRFLDFYKNLDDLEVVKSTSRLSKDDNRRYSRDRRRDQYKGHRGSEGAKRGRKGRGNDGDYIWLKVNLGRRDGISAPELMKFINQNTRGKTVDFGRIDIQPTSTRFQVDKNAADFLGAALRRKVHNGKRIRID